MNNSCRIYIYKYIFQNIRQDLSLKQINQFYDTTIQQDAIRYFYT